MMLLGLLRLGGIGQLTTGITLGILALIPFRRGQRWAYWAIPIIGFIYGTPIAYGAYALHHSTQAATPWKAVVIILLVLLVAFLLTLRSAGEVNPPHGDKKTVA
jgi:cobalamin synthase